MEYQLRRWKLEDTPDLVRAIGSRNILDNLRDGIPFPYTVADGEAFIRGTLEAPADSRYSWAIAVNGAAVGSIGIFRGENIHRRTAELGYYIAEEHWGKGIVTAAVKKACAHVFRGTDIVRIFAEPFAANTASCRVLEKAGFVLEGTMRKNAIKNGRIIDMLLYALVREEF